MVRCNRLASVNYHWVYGLTHFRTHVMGNMAKTRFAKLVSLSLGAGLILMGLWYLESMYWLGEWFNVALGSELHLPTLTKALSLVVLLSGFGIVCLHQWGYFTLYAISVVGTICEWVFALPPVCYLPFSAVLVHPLVVLGVNKTIALWILNFASVVALAVSHYVLRKEHELRDANSKRLRKVIAGISGVAGLLMLLRGLLLFPLAIGDNVYAIIFLLYHTLPLLFGGLLGIAIAYLLLKE